MKRHGVLLVLAAIAVGGGAAAAEVPAAPEGLGYFVGDWSASARDPGDGSTVVVSYKVAPALDGAWLAGEAESADLSLRSRDVWGRDPATGEVMRTIFDKSGVYGVVRSRGWEGDRLVLEGEARSKGGTIRVRETISRVGPGEFTAVWEALRDGVWTTYSIERVTRRPVA